MNTTLYERGTRVAPSTTGAATAPSVVETSAPAVSWPAIFAGAFVAAAVSVMLVAIGSGFGFAAVSPWPASGPSPTTFAVSTGVWLIVTQWLSSGLGGYIAGRMRTKWVGVHTHEVFFRDTAHGFVTWAVATVMVALVAAAAGVALANVGAHATATSGATPDATQVDAIRKAAAASSLFTGLSMVIGAFIACVAAALGGNQRDEHP
jgi:hypothetical protein